MRRSFAVLLSLSVSSAVFACAGSQAAKSGATGEPTPGSGPCPVCVYWKVEKPCVIGVLSVGEGMSADNFPIQSLEALFDGGSTTKAMNIGDGNVGDNAYVCDAPETSDPVSVKWVDKQGESGTAQISTQSGTAPDCPPGS